MDKVHVFEQSGLGKAPFVFLGTEEIHSHAFGIDGPFYSDQDFGGSCDYCGHYIRIGCHIQSADGKHFVVGTDCVKKTGDDGLRNRLNDEIRMVKRQKHVMDWKWAQENYERLVDNLDKLPHPYMSDKSMYDYIVYSLNHGHFESTEKRIISAVRKAERMDI